MDDFQDYELWLGDLPQEDDDRDWQLNNEQQRYEEEYGY